MADPNMIFVISLSMFSAVARCHLFMGLGRRASKTKMCAADMIVASVRI